MTYGLNTRNGGKKLGAGGYESGSIYGAGTGSESDGIEFQ